MNIGTNKHDERLRQWQSRVPEKTRRLSELFMAKVAPILEAARFKRVGIDMQQMDSPIEGRRLQFERVSDGHIDAVYAFFDKYASPRFQVGFWRRMQSEPDRIIRSGYLVKHPAEYYHEWGKPRWLPAVLWPMTTASKIVNEVVQSTGQIFTFLETGERGPNISRSSGAMPVSRAN